MLEGAVKDWRKVVQNVMFVLDIYNLQIMLRRHGTIWKKNTKPKAVQVKKYTIETGGGEPSIILLNTMDIISPTLTEGLQTIGETQAQFEYED